MNQLNSDLREAWEQCSTPELEERLQAELEKHPPEDDRVLLLLHILEDREAKSPLKLTSQEEEALERYRQKSTKQKKRRYGWLSIAASVVLVFALALIAVPQEASAESFWGMLQRMTDSVIGYFSPEDKFDDAEETYVFTTDHPGLQQVYDAVVELGVTEPVVPMWLPDGFLLDEFRIFQTPATNCVNAIFKSNENEIIYRIDVFGGEPAHQYYKDEAQYETWELEGCSYQVARNNDLWVVIWEKENIICAITVDCQEETLQTILESIYVMEDE